MSKLDIRLSYKNVCILKHALRDQIKDKDEWLESPNTDKDESFVQLVKKELEEEKRALECITEEINNSCIKHSKNWRG